MQVETLSCRKAARYLHPETQLISLGLSSSEMDCQKEEVCCGQHFRLFLEIMVVSTRLNLPFTLREFEIAAALQSTVLLWKNVTENPFF